MLRRFLDFQLSFFEPGKRFHRFRPFVSAIDAFCFEPLINLQQRPFIRDAVDLKRWMILVIIALLPTVFMAILNTGVQGFVYGRGDLDLMRSYLQASSSFSGYFHFIFQWAHLKPILFMGFTTFIPVLLVSYITGIICEGLIASIRGHEIAEGFLVTGMLIPLSLPPTIPLWVVAVGTALGVVIGKEVFGGTGMNILNPALTARAFLFFTFPGNLSGDVWTGRHPLTIDQSLQKINQAAGLGDIDGYSQATALQGLNGAISSIKKIHVDTIATYYHNIKTATSDVMSTYLQKWEGLQGLQLTLQDLSFDQFKAFLTSPIQEGGLGMIAGNFAAAKHFGDTLYGFGKFSSANLFWGNVAGSMGETSTFACLLGAAFLILVGVGSWRTMLSVAIGAIVTASLFQFASSLGVEAGAWNPAKFSLPAYRHLIMGSLAFGLVYMATDPVSSPGMELSKYIYGFLIGVLTVIIRAINPAYPEGVMLAILFANVFAPLIDYYVVRNYRRSLKRVSRT